MSALISCLNSFDKNAASFFFRIDIWFGYLLTLISLLFCLDLNWILILKVKRKVWKLMEVSTESLIKFFKCVKYLLKIITDNNYNLSIIWPSESN